MIQNILLLVSFLNFSSADLQAMDQTVLDDFGDVEEHYDALQSFPQNKAEEFCFIRVHYWARQLQVQFGTVSHKAFILFTPMFQRRANLNWWYHVVPFVKYRDQAGVIRDVVMDKAHLQSPMALEDWVRSYSPSGCREGKDLADYDADLIHGGCVLVRKSMYDFVPDDFQREKSTWMHNDWVRIKRYFAEKQIAFGPSIWPKDFF